jgi:hypothetical protein
VCFVGELKGALQKSNLRSLREVHVFAYFYFGALQIEQNACEDVDLESTKFKVIASGECVFSM